MLFSQNYENRLSVERVNDVMICNNSRYIVYKTIVMTV